MNIEEIREKISDRIIKVISSRTGLAEATIVKLRDDVSDPRLSTIKTLSDYFDSH